MLMIKTILKGKRMELVRQSVVFLDMNQLGLGLVEKAGRTCWKSEDKMCEGSDILFAQKMLALSHEAMIEFGWLCLRVICNRGVSHEIVRHRLFSFAQESTRYCNYRGGVAFIIPGWSLNMIEGYQKNIKEVLYSQEEVIWLDHKSECEKVYKQMLELGQPPQDARDNLPIATKTEICMGGNFREWRHFFKMRHDKKAHPQMQEVAQMALDLVRERVPVLFDEYVE